MSPAESYNNDFTTLGYIGEITLSILPNTGPWPYKVDVLALPIGSEGAINDKITSTIMGNFRPIEKELILGHIYKEIINLKFGNTIELNINSFNFTASNLLFFDGILLDRLDYSSYLLNIFDYLERKHLTSIAFPLFTQKGISFNIAEAITEYSQVILKSSTTIKKNIHLIMLANKPEEVPEIITAFKFSLGGRLYMNPQNNVPPSTFSQTTIDQAPIQEDPPKQPTPSNKGDRTNTLQNQKTLKSSIEIASELCARLSNEVKIILSIADQLGPRRVSDHKLLSSTLLLSAMLKFAETHSGTETSSKLFILYNIANVKKALSNHMNGYLISSKVARRPLLIPPFIAATPNIINIFNDCSKNCGNTELSINVLLEIFLTYMTNAKKFLHSIGVNDEILQSIIHPQDITQTPNRDLPPSSRHSEPQPQPNLTGFLNDQPINDPNAKDLLSIDKEVEVFARLILSRNVHPPLAIGLFGEWGSGKSFFMQRMEQTIRNISENPSKDHKEYFLENIVPIRFNAWHYMESNLMASLVNHIFQELDRWLHDKKEVDNAAIAPLFNQLFTSRQLLLESINNYTILLQNKHCAEHELKTAKNKLHLALGKTQPLTATALWNTICLTFEKEIGGSKSNLEDEIEKLGLLELKNNTSAIAKLLQDSRDQAVRAGMMRQALTSKFGTTKSLFLLGVMAGFPFALEFANVLLTKIFSPELTSTFNSSMVSISAILATLTKVGKDHLQTITTSLNQLDKYRIALDKAVQNTSEEEEKRLRAAEKLIKDNQVLLAETERQVAARRDQVAMALNALSHETPQQRLSRFISHKATSGDYSQHLGLITTIRKDFEQLTALMVEETQDIIFNLYNTNKAFEEKFQELIRNTELEKNELDKINSLWTVPVTLPQKPRYFDRIVLFIDDLDRCAPEKVLEVLQAIHLLLSFKLFVVVVGVDVRWLVRSLEKTYPHLLHLPPTHTSISAAGHIQAMDYLEKIFQIPYWVPGLSENSMHTFVDSLVQECRPATKSKQTQPPATLSPETSTKPTESPVTPIPTPQPTTNPPKIIPTTEGPQRENPSAEIRQVELDDEEQSLLKHFAKLIGHSPRRAKRYVNLYHLLNVTLSLDSQGDPWINKCATIALLAMVTHGETIHHLLEELKIQKEPPPPETINPNILMQVLMNINQLCTNTSKPYHEVLQTMIKLAPTVRRFSFEGRLLHSQRSKVEHPLQ